MEKQSYNNNNNTIMINYLFIYIFEANCYLQVKSKKKNY